MFDALPLVVEVPGDRGLLTEAAERAAAEWMLPPPELVRVGANGVFVCGDTVLRVGRSTAPMGVALRFAQRLRDAGIRAAVPARDDWIELANGLSVTAWRRIRPDRDASVDWERVGATVAMVHAIDPTTVDHPLPFCADLPWWRLDEMMLLARHVDEQAKQGMQHALDTHRWWIESARTQPVTLCHGDVHPGNVLVDAEGPVLIDWDLLCVGPAAWDHAALMRWADRWGGKTGDYEAFAAGYGVVIDEQLAAAIAETRLLAATLVRLGRARLDPAQADEAARRLAYWRGDADAPMWRPQ